MKRILSLVLALVMLLALGACASAETTETAEKTVIRIEVVSGRAEIDSIVTTME